MTRHPPTLDPRIDAHEWLHITNRSRRKPWPICPDCDLPYSRAEGDQIYPGRCAPCGVGILERLFRRLVRARDDEALEKVLLTIARFATGAPPDGNRPR